MKFKKIISIYLIIVFLCVSMPFCTYAENDFDLNAKYADGKVIFKYSENTVNCNSIDISDADSKGEISAEDIGNDLKNCGIESLKVIGEFSDNNKKEEINTNSLENSDSQIYLADTDDDVFTVCKRLKKIDGVEYAEPDYLLEPDSITMPAEVTLPSDKYNDYQKNYFEDSLHLPEAWQTYDTLGKGVTVAVLDTGVFIDNPEIHDNLWIDENGHYGYNAYTNGYDISPDKDKDGNYFVHGLNTTGIVGMVANGNAGVGAAPESSIMAIKVSNADATGTQNMPTSALINGVNYAVANGADIVSVSIGSYNKSDSFENACDAAYNSGVLVFASAGNDSVPTSLNVRYPAGFSSVVGVMATDCNGYIAEFPSGDFSNFDDVGGYYDIAAPGNNILGLGPSDDTLSLACGTSQSTPLAAAVAALYKSAYPACTVQELREAICNFSASYCAVKPEEADCSKIFPVLNALEVMASPINKPDVTTVAGSTTHIDSKKNYIYGIDENYTDISSYVNVADGTYTLEPTANGIGTGTKLNVYNKYGVCCKTYYIVIFGDADGDAKSDGCDALYIERILDGYLVGDILPCVKFAMDVDFDDEVTEYDFDIVEKYAIGLDFVSQIR